MTNLRMAAPMAVWASFHVGGDGPASFGTKFSLPACGDCHSHSLRRRVGRDSRTDPQGMVVAKTQRDLGITGAAHKLDSPLRSRISDEGQIDGPVLQGPRHLAAVCPISNTHGLRFQDIFTFHQLEGLIAAFVHSYNHERYHGAIQYVTPLQRHKGQHQKILHHRQGRKEEARQRRIEINRQRTSQTIHKAA